MLLVLFQSVTLADHTSVKDSPLFKPWLDESETDAGEDASETAHRHRASGSNDQISGGADRNTACKSRVLNVHLKNGATNREENEADGNREKKESNLETKQRGKERMNRRWKDNQSRKNNKAETEMRCTNSGIDSSLAHHFPLALAESFAHDEACDSAAHEGQQSIHSCAHLSARPRGHHAIEGGPEQPQNHRADQTENVTEKDEADRHNQSAGGSETKEKGTESAG